MTRFADLVDVVGATGWGLAQPRATGAAMLYRAAMRAAPLGFARMRPVHAVRFGATLAIRPMLIAAAYAVDPDNARLIPHARSAVKATRRAAAARYSAGNHRPWDAAKRAATDADMAAHDALRAAAHAVAFLSRPQMLQHGLDAANRAPSWQDRESPRPRSGPLGLPLVRQDPVVTKTTLLQSPLALAPAAAQAWGAVKPQWVAAGPPFSAFVPWYDSAVSGRPFTGDWATHWDLVAELAGLDALDWDGGETGGRRLAELLAGARPADAGSLSPGEPETLPAIIGSALYDFRFDALEQVMRAVPMADDWKRLEDPEKLTALLADAEALLESFDLLVAALRAEGTAMQGAGAIATYMAAVSGELRDAATEQFLRIDKVMEYGRILEAMAARDGTQAEFGVLAEPLADCIERLRALVRTHFAHTLARLSPLREIFMEPDVAPADVLRRFREVVGAVATGGQGRLPPLHAEDAAVLQDILDSLDLKVRELGSAGSPQARSSLQREIDFQLAKIGATAGLYRERAGAQIGRSGEAIDAAQKWERRATGLARWADMLMELF